MRSFFILLFSIISFSFLIVSADASVNWPLGEDDVIGHNLHYEVKSGETLFDIARSFGVGITELQIANPGVSLRSPGNGELVKIPLEFILPAGPRSGLVVNVPEMRMYYYPEDGGSVYTWPISTGRVGWETPIGVTSIVRKKANPSWFPPQSIRDEAAKNGHVLPRIVDPGPDNPLGSHALYLGFPSYLIHGTNDPYSIGMRVSHGCIRMYPEHIVNVFEMIEAGTPVNFVYELVKTGWKGDQLYIEVHPIPGDILSQEGLPGVDEVVHAVESFIEETSEPGMLFNIYWKKIQKALHSANGTPFIVGNRQ